MGDTLGELVGLVRAYARQETLDPLKALGRFLAFGLVGVVFLATGSLLLTIGAVRLLQSELATQLSGHLTWVPYLGGIFVAGLFAGLAALRILGGPARRGRR